MFYNILYLFFLYYIYKFLSGNYSYLEIFQNEGSGYQKQAYR